MPRPRQNFTHRAVTLEEYRALDLTRPLTGCGLIGEYSIGKRQSDAMASLAVTATPRRIPRTTPTTRGARAA